MASSSIVEELTITLLPKINTIKFDLTGFWSRRIDAEHRLVYRIEGNELHTLACRYHY